jgi:acyl-coenzyme A synthetase/AMP-(fatty) acid ligase
MVMKGYLGEADAGGLFLTSDRGRVTTEGSVEVLGRADRMIITGGENVDPAAVELLVTRHPQVVEVTVVGVPDPEWGERMVAAYAGQASVPELEALLDDLPAYARPKQWFRLEALPRTELGKVDHAHLYRLLQI